MSYLLDITFPFHVGMGLVIGSFIVAGFYYVFNKRIDETIVKKGSDLATDIVKSPDIQTATEGLVKQLFSQKTMIEETNKFFISVMSDQGVQTQIKETLISLVKTDEVKKVTNELIASILSDASNKEETRKFIMILLTDKSVQDELKKILSDLLQDEKTRQEVHNFVVSALQNDHIKKVLIDLLTSIVLNDQTKQTLQELLVAILQNPQIKTEVYAILKALLEEMTKDKDFNKLLVEFLSTTLMNTLNTPVNEKYIKDKIIELLTAKDVMDSISNSIMDVIQRDDLKKVLGDTAVATLSMALKKHYPKSFGWMV